MPAMAIVWIIAAVVFAVAEAVLLCCAVRAFFDAMTYFGERSDALSLIRPFPLDRRGKHLCRVCVLQAPQQAAAFR